MLSETPDDVGYVSLCDQDDIWIDGKLDRAASWLSELKGPAMYCSAVEVVDQDSTRWGAPHISTRTCPGQRAGPEHRHRMHHRDEPNGAASLPPGPRPSGDARLLWIYAATAAAGTVVYDPSTWVLYRQHGANSIGLAPSTLEQWRRRLGQHVASGSHRVHTVQAAELLRVLSAHITPDARSTLTAFVSSQNSFTGRIRYALTGLRSASVGSTASSIASSSPSVGSENRHRDRRHEPRDSVTGVSSPQSASHGDIVIISHCSRGHRHHPGQSGLGPARPHHAVLGPVQLPAPHLALPAGTGPPRPGSHVGRHADLRAGSGQFLSIAVMPFFYVFGTDRGPAFSLTSSSGPSCSCRPERWLSSSSAPGPDTGHSHHERRP